MADIIINPNIDKENRLNQIFEFIKDRQFYCAVAYAKVCKRREEAYNKLNNTKDDYFDKLYTALAYAFDDPWYGVKAYDNFNFTKEKKVNKIDDKSFNDDKNFISFVGKEFIDFLFLSIAIRILYSYDENLTIIDKKRVIDELTIFVDSAEEDIKKNVKEIVSKLTEIVELLCEFNINEHMTLSYIDKENSLDKEDDNEEIKKINLEEEIKKYCSNINDAESKIRNKIFLDSNLYTYCKDVIDVVDNDYEVAFLSLSDLSLSDIKFYNFIDDNELELDPINIKDYVRNINTKFADSEENSDKYKKIWKDLENFLNTVYNYVKKIGDKKAHNEAYKDINRYKKISDEVCDKLGCVIKNINILLNKNDRKDRKEKKNFGYIAGLLTLLYTLCNIKDHISSDFEHYTYQYGKYFYVPFLLSDDVLLDKDFLPDFPTFYFDKNFFPNFVKFDYNNIDEKKRVSTFSEEKRKEFIKLMMPEYIIVEHANKFKGTSCSSSELKFTLDKFKLYNLTNRNYTIKERIDDYFGKKENISNNEIEDAITLSKVDQQDFYGKLELAECYRKLEDVGFLLKEDELDKIRENAFGLYINFHKNIDEKFYVWLCVDNHNFGYFKKVADNYSKYIDDNSKALSYYWSERIELEKNKEEYKEHIKEDKDKKFIKKFINFFNKLVYFLKDENYYAISEFLNNAGLFLNNDNNDNKDDLNNFLSDYTEEKKYERSCELLVNRKLERLIEDDENINNDSKEFLLNIVSLWEDIFSELKKSSVINRDKLAKLLSFLGFEINEKDITIKDGIKIDFLDGDGKLQNLENCEIIISNKSSNISNNHQIASFIPYIFKNGFRIIFINKGFAFDDKINDLIALSNKPEILGNNTIIFFNGQFKLDDKRKLSKAVKNKRQKDSKLFLFIDRVVMLFLLKNYSIKKKDDANTEKKDFLEIADEKSKKEKRKVDVKEIVNDCLMSIILPFGFYQPYDSSTSGTANKDIMFVGRKEELDKIKNPTLPFMIVYGGRQLGKSLLLEQAEKDINREKSNCIAIYCDIRNKEDFKPQNKDDYKKIYNDITLGYIGKKLREYNIVDKDIKEWKGFQKEIEKFLDNPQNINKKLYLFLDEVDDFVTSCKKLDTEAPFLMIKEIADKYKDKGRFNVVFAGLNLYVDFRGTNGFFAKNQNGIVGQLKKNDSNFILIEPFGIEEACELIERPLHYLGLDFSESLSLIYLILYNTNYYPCLIQMYCESMLNNINMNKGPIYKMDKKDIYELLITETFQTDVSNTFEKTLNLNSNGENDVSGDNTFKYLANMLALLCHKKEYRAYKLSEFVELAKGNDEVIKDIGRIEKICKLNDEDKLNDLLDLLVKLSVFERMGDKMRGYSYRFKKFSLYRLMGTEEKICGNLKKYIKEDENFVCR